MINRHPHNSNLTLFTANAFNGYPVIKHRGPLIVEYLDSIHKTLWRALSDHPRTTAIRVDLRYPAGVEPTEARSDITKFIDSLKAQIGADQLKKKRGGKRGHPCNLRYVWARESNQALSAHYHVLLLLNHDAYNCLGHYSAAGGNMASRIKKAWASALGYDLDDIEGAVHFPQAPVYCIDFNSVGFDESFNDLFYRVSYLAKVNTKQYGQGRACFGSSRN